MVEQGKIDRLRVLWNKGRNFYLSFLTELGDIQNEIGNPTAFENWCDYELKISVEVISAITGILHKADARRVKEEFAAAKASARETKRIEREAESHRKLEEKIARDAERVWIEAAEKAKAKAAKDNAKKRRYTQRAKEETRAKYEASVPVTSRFSSGAKPENIEDNQLVSDIKHAYARLQSGRAEWIEASIEIAALLYQARTRHESDREFGAWLDRNEFPMKHDDRAALLNLGSNLEAMRRTLEGTDRNSYRLIWGDVKKLIDARPTVAATDAAP